MKDIVTDNELIHDRIHDSYEQEHAEIFNGREQTRLRESLAQATAHIETPASPRSALDYGCGSGNLTRHLLTLGFQVTAADVSGKFLELIQAQYGQTGKLSTFKISGKDVGNIPHSAFDFVGTYSVLHHIPGYLQAVAELSELVRPGGILYFDHEVNQNYWDDASVYHEFVRLAHREAPDRWLRFVNPSKYVTKIKELPLAFRRLKNPRYMPEGDIHVWPDDHIDWDKIEAVLRARGYQIVRTQDYLLFKQGYPVDLYENYKDKCSDMRLLVAQRRA